MDKRRAYLVHAGSTYDNSWEFHGVYPVRRSDIVERLSEHTRAYTEERLVTRAQLEDIMEDDVTDEEWDEYQKV